MPGPRVFAAATAHWTSLPLASRMCVQRGGFLDENIATFQDTGAALVRRGVVEHRHGLAREREQGRAVGALQRGGKGAGGLLGIRGTDDVEVRDHAQAGDGFDGLVGRAILAHADGIVRVDIDDRQLR